MKERPWFVFAGSNYYPSGGFNDYKGAFETEKEAVAYAKGLIHSEGNCDWFDVVDIRTKYFKEVR